MEHDDGEGRLVQLWSPNIKKDNSVDERRYKGKACLRHPELEGLRWKSSSNCIECQRTRNVDRNKRPDVKAARAAYQRMWRGANMLNWQLHDRIRIEAGRIAARECGDLSKWTDYWDQAWGATPGHLRPAEAWTGPQGPVKG